MFRVVQRNGPAQCDSNGSARKRKYNFNGTEIFRIIEKSIDENTKTILSFFIMFLVGDLVLLHLTGDMHTIASAITVKVNDILLACDLAPGLLIGAGIKLN